MHIHPFLVDALEGAEPVAVPSGPAVRQRMVAGGIIGSTAAPYIFVLEAATVLHVTVQRPSCS